MSGRRYLKFLHNFPRFVQITLPDRASDLTPLELSGENLRLCASVLFPPFC